MGDSRYFKWQSKSKEELQSILDNSSTFIEVANKIGYKSTHGQYTNALKRMIEEMDLDTTKLNNNRHIFMSNLSKRNAIEKDKEKIKKYFIENSQTKRTVIRRYVLKYNLLHYQCNKCGNVGEWNKKPLVLELDHINGKFNDHRLENLQWLCPNCHAQTSTYRGKNVNK